MKRCPKCNSTYTDDMLSYCLTDGTPLVRQGKGYDSEATMVVNPPPAVFPIAPSSSYNSESQQQAGGRRTQVVPLILMLVAGLVIGLLVTYILLRPATSAPTQSSQIANAPTTNTTGIRTSETSSKQSTANPAPKPTSTSPANVSSQDARWFIILGTFEPSDRAGANSRLQRMKAEGFTDAYIANTNEYSNFTPDKLAVVLGPYSESEARRIGSKVTSLSPTIKPGW